MNEVQYARYLTILKKMKESFEKDGAFLRWKNAGMPVTDKDPVDRTENENTLVLVKSLYEGINDVLQAHEADPSAQQMLSDQLKDRLNRFLRNTVQDIFEQQKNNHFEDCNNKDKEEHLLSHVASIGLNLGVLNDRLNGLDVYYDKKGAVDSLEVETTSYREAQNRKFEEIYNDEDNKKLLLRFGDVGFQKGEQGLRLEIDKAEEELKAETDKLEELKNKTGELKLLQEVTAASEKAFSDKLKEITSLQREQDELRKQMKEVEEAEKLRLDQQSQDEKAYQEELAGYKAELEQANLKYKKEEEFVNSQIRQGKENQRMLEELRNNVISGKYTYGEYLKDTMTYNRFDYPLEETQKMLAQMKDMKEKYPFAYNVFEVSEKSVRNAQKGNKGVEGLDEFFKLLEGVKAGVKLYPELQNTLNQMKTSADQLNMKQIEEFFKAEIKYIEDARASIVARMQNNLSSDAAKKNLSSIKNSYNETEKSYQQVKQYALSPVENFMKGDTDAINAIGLKIAATEEKLKKNSKEAILEEYKNKKKIVEEQIKEKQDQENAAKKESNVLQKKWSDASNQYHELSDFVQALKNHNAEQGVINAAKKLQAEKLLLSKYEQMKASMRPLLDQRARLLNAASTVKEKLAPRGQVIAKGQLFNLSRNKIHDGLTALRDKLEGYTKPGWTTEKNSSFYTQMLHSLDQAIRQTDPQCDPPADKDQITALMIDLQDKADKYIIAKHAQHFIFSPSRQRLNRLDAAQNIKDFADLIQSGFEVYPTDLEMNKILENAEICANAPDAYAYSDEKLLDQLSKDFKNTLEKRNLENDMEKKRNIKPQNNPLIR